jgi:hypothetical protein
LTPVFLCAAQTGADLLPGRNPETGTPGTLLSLTQSTPC